MTHNGATMSTFSTLSPPSGPSSDEAHRLGPFTRKLLRWASQESESEDLAAYRALRVRPSTRPRQEVVAVGAVLLRAAIDLERAAREGTRGRAYELFYREDSPMDEQGPSTIGESLVRALPKGERALTALVIQEATAKSKRKLRGRHLARVVARWIELFELLAYEASRLQHW